MSKQRTATHIHQAKDDLFYPSYEAMRDANVRVNNARMQELGLGGSFQKTKPKKKSKRKAPPPSPPIGELRRSNRVRMVTPEFNLLPDELTMTRQVKKKRPTGSGSRSATLQPHELEALKDLPNWLDGMEEFLLTVPHGNANRVVSPDNAKTVMRQTRRMVAGVGIEYHRWEDGIVWKKGVKIDLSMDFDALFDEAVEFEAQHGRDLGNGWLMRHPIRKLQCYQEYLAEKNKGAEGAQEEKKEEATTPKNN